MKRFFLLFFVLASFLSAVEVLTEGKVGYFIPTDAQFRATYGEDGILGEIETSVCAWDHFYPWASVGMYRNVSHHVGKSHIYFIPIGAGLKYIYPFKYVSIYAGAGALPTYLHIDNNSPLLASTQERWGCGGIFKMGFLSNRVWNLFIDLFAEYSYLQMPFHGQRVALSDGVLSNFTIGGGVGYRFGPSHCVDEDDEL